MSCVPVPRFALKAIAGLWFCLCVAGCGGGESAQETSSVSSSTFSKIQSQVFDVSCSSDSCHSSVGQAAGLVLEKDHSYASLMNVPVSNPVASADGKMRVLPGHPEGSFLINKLTANLASGEGASMPWNAALLSPHAVEVIAAWIAAGAPKDAVVAADDGTPLQGDGNDPTEAVLPPPASGVQLTVTARAIADGTEETLCHYLKLPSDVDFEVNRLQIAVTGGSHHIHLYRPFRGDLNVPDHWEVCNAAVNFDDWSLIVGTQLRHADWELPAGVAYHFRAGEQLLVQTHFVNVGSLETRGEGKVKMNLHAADPTTITAHAGAIFGQDRDVFVAAHTNPTQSAKCVFPKPMTIIAQTGHYHFRGRRFSTYLWADGARGAEIYRHEGYDDPKFLVYDAATAPVLEADEGLEWECYWENPSNNDYKFGPFTDTNEHCNLFAFYYPTATLHESITCVADHGVETTTVRAGD